MERVAVLGASDKPDRYSNMALKLLMEYGHEVYPIHPVKKTILGLNVYKSIDDIKDNIDTLTIYLNPRAVEAEIKKILNLSPGRVIFNPGTESGEAISVLKDNGITVVEGCTLVMLKTSQF